MLEFSGSVRRPACAGAAGGSIRQIGDSGKLVDRAVKPRLLTGGAKKNRRVRRRFFGNSVALRAPSLLSIRQRPEMPKKVKVKLCGHGGNAMCQ
ncbi:hypothetical protein NX868_22765 [Burkholderia thailandensis]|uniref:hypothetical protein n=1 Tax=Burkholderia thailandensis TaxID=57975 RepID=UPI0015E0B274|nr:hypothetical protein [Burkholderia thailandensis]MCS3389875.1 hypothetical protein [Burkholderia thailandensis]MCS6424803.1 hypothetical protein [Burkholderia thailandensis]MCS6452532.1 hypothetical protein [Burkholderia thailandensis]MCS6462819.1 hypothetical protein [Burkholderia thailandensis]MCS6485084.1 hypothetical protein [Burkholderia thailandensis]